MKEILGNLNVLIKKHRQTWHVRIISIWNIKILFYSLPVWNALLYFTCLWWKIVTLHARPIYWQGLLMKRQRQAWHQILMPTLWGGGATNCPRGSHSDPHFNGGSHLSQGRTKIIHQTFHTIEHLLKLILFDWRRHHNFTVFNIPVIMVLGPDFFGW